MVGRTRVQSDPLIRSSFPPLGLCKDGEVGRSMELDGRYNSTHTRVYIYIYIYQRRWMDTLRFDASSRNPPPRKAFIGERAPSLR